MVELRIRGALLSLLLAASGCTGASLHREPPTSRAIAGEYGHDGPIAHLTLTPEGEYECFVLAAISAEGCGNVVGNGFSTGRWHLDGDSITFTPLNEPPDLYAKFAEITATPVEDGLTLRLGERTLLLERAGSPWFSPADSDDQDP